MKKSQHETRSSPASKRGTGSQLIILVIVLLGLIAVPACRSSSSSRTEEVVSETPTTGVARPTEPTEPVPTETLRPTLPPVSPPTEIPPATVTPYVEDTQVSQLPISFYANTKANNQGEYEIIEYFNLIARENDKFIFTERALLEDSANLIQAMSAVRSGKVIQAFSSWQTAQEHMEVIKDYVDVILYDLEKWEKSEDEWHDISASSQQMVEVVRENELEYLAHLSYQLATNNQEDPSSVENMAQYADYYSFAAYPCLEQLSLSECVVLYVEVAERARSVNPDISLIMLISLEKDISLEEHYALVAEMASLYDEIGIFSYPNRASSQQKLKAFISLLRP